MSTGEMQHERGYMLVFFCVSVPQATISRVPCTQMNGIWPKALMKNRFSWVLGLQYELHKPVLKKCLVLTMASRITVFCWFQGNIYLTPSGKGRRMSFGSHKTVLLLLWTIKVGRGFRGVSHGLFQTWVLRLHCLSWLVLLMLDLLWSPSSHRSKKSSPFPGALAEQGGEDGCERSVGFSALLLARVGYLPCMLPVSNGFWHIISV